jgi:hypothetical protein
MKVFVTFSKRLKLLHGATSLPNVSSAKIDSNKRKAGSRDSGKEALRY